MLRILRDNPMHAYYYGGTMQCRAASDGECFWDDCPQTRDDEPKKTGRHCPLDNHHDLEI